MNPKKKKTVKRIIAAVIVVAVIGGGAWFLKGKISTGSSAADIMTEYIGRGSITSVVNGSGVAVAKNSESISILSSGMVNEVYVKEGDHVMPGDALYSMDSSDAEKAFATAERALKNAQKELDEIVATSGDTDVRAEFAGTIINATELNVGDTIAKGQVLGTLVDNNTMVLHLYFSYAYENEIYVGQKAEISIPSGMSNLEGKVSEVRMVRRIVPEGTVLFEVIFEVSNPGTLTEGTVASASIDLGGEIAYPYESGTLKYSRQTSITAKASGEVSSSRLWNYAVVKSGESLVKLTADSSEDSIAAAESAVKSAEKDYENAQKSLNSVNAKASIEGTVLSVGVVAGEEAQIGTVAISIADTSTMVINAKVDEMNVSSIKAGMYVTINQWGNSAVGVVKSVSLSGQYENGVSTFPVVIEVDNTDGLLMSGSYVDYELTASQSEDCLMVSLQAVKYVQTENGTQTVVFVRADSAPENMVETTADMSDIPDGFYPVAIEIGISDNYNTEILSGVEEGTEVYVSEVRSSDW